jgi:hypothetical protein
MKTEKRKLASGREVSQQKTECPLTISSKCPDKWVFVDLETGDFWHHNERPKHKHNGWRGASLTELSELKKLVAKKLKNLELVPFYIKEDNLIHLFKCKRYSIAPDVSLCGKNSEDVVWDRHVTGYKKCPKCFNK